MHTLLSNFIILNFRQNPGSVCTPTYCYKIPLLLCTFYCLASNLPSCPKESTGQHFFFNLWKYKTVYKKFLMSHFLRWRWKVITWFLKKLQIKVSFIYMVTNSMPKILFQYKYRLFTSHKSRDTVYCGNSLFRGKYVSFCRLIVYFVFVPSVIWLKSNLPIFLACDQFRKLWLGPYKIYIRVINTFFKGSYISTKIARFKVFKYLSTLFTERPLIIGFV